MYPITIQFVTVIILIAALSKFEVNALRNGIQSLSRGHHWTKHLAYRNEQEREEQFRIQQEMLTRRKNPKVKAAEQKKVDERREAMSSQVMKTMWAKKTPSNIDPLIEWQKAKERGELKDLGYEETTKNRDLRFSIPLIASPIDQPAYDNGLRFDLRLPYAETGYEDQSADVMGNIGKAFGGMFKKKSETTEETPPASPPPPKKKNIFGF